jgi:hypothetical protein
MDDQELVDFEIAPHDWVKLEKLPKRSCKHCYGRGYEGVDRDTGERIICRCTRRALKED